MNIIFLDRKSLGEDINLSGFERFGDITMYNFSSPGEVRERSKDADILVINKALINAETISDASHLRLICVTATGINNLDTDYLKSRGIEWRNVAGYSTETVTQHTFAMLFYLLEHLPYYDDYVKSGKYAEDTLFTHFEKHFSEISGKTWGIIGLGAIGKRVYEIGQAFGAKMQYFSTSGKNHDERFNEVDLDTLLSTSDIISIHAALTEKTEGLINSNTLSKMKKTAILLNLGRGQIIDENALYDALMAGYIAAAGLDVLCREPMDPKNPLLKIKDSNRLFITPHIAWASVEARQRLINTIEHQIEDYLSERVDQ